MDDARRLKRNAYMRAWKKKNKMSVNKTNQRWKDANRSQVRKSEREGARRRRKLDPQRFRAADKKWRDSHKEINAVRQRQWAAKNPGYYSRWHFAKRAKNPAVYMCYHARRRATILGVPFDLCPDDIIVPEVCPVLGISLVFAYGTRRSFDPNSPSLDRFDPKKGYTKDNVRVISNRANILKRDATVEELRAVVAYMEAG